MDDSQIDIYALFAVAEFSVVLLVLAVVFVLRSKALSARVRMLQGELKKARAETDPIGFDQYLRDAIIRNQALIEGAAVAEDKAEKKAGELLGLRKKFLELELTAHALEKNPVQFQQTLAAGFSELIEQMRPEAETVTLAAASEPSAQPSSAEPATADEPAAPRSTLDTHDQEFNRLKQVINNQQDAMSALRAELKARESDIEDLDGILRKLDEFEQHDGELQQCLKMLEHENEQLKAAKSADQGNGAKVASLSSAQLGGLKNMIGNQQETIANLQDLIKELAPEASKAADLEAAINGIQRANQELNSCVAVLEDENSMLRAELEAANAQLDREEALRDAAADAVDVVPDAGEPDADGGAAEEEKQQLEIKVQELEALVEFKDAAIEELEKQYNKLEAKYHALSGGK
jgi:predicted RNase H-like nuclease (RuvC/YqgF family)